jgi:RNA polymerase sigma-70 factor (ECF subfamily)
MKDDLTAIIDRARDDTLSVDQQHAAFAVIVERFEETALHWAMRLLDDAEDARDATQDAFVAAWLKLRTLRDAAAFGLWLKRLVATQCRRRRRRRNAELTPDAADASAAQAALDQRERQRILAKAMTALSEEEHRIVVLFYFLGRTMEEIAAILRIPRGTVGKRLYSARIAIRRSLPPEVRKDYLPLRPSVPFLQKVKMGLFDEYTGDYRFKERPDHVVRVRREGTSLVSYGGGQRNILASIGDDELITAEFDGGGRFERNRAGRIVGFVYYEFGARLGVAIRQRGRIRS